MEPDPRELVRSGDARPIRVLHVIDSLGVSGGSEKQLITNLTCFSDPLITHRVVYPFEPAQSIEELIPTGVATGCLFPSDQNRRGRVRTAKAICRVVTEWRPHLIHCSLAHASFASRVAGRLCGVPVLETLVNIGYESERLVDNPRVKAWKLEAHRHLDRLSMRSVRCFHAVSRTVAESWVRTTGIPEESIRIIARGVDVDELKAAVGRGPSRNELRASLDIPDQATVVLAVGRQEPQKGHRYLLEAIAILRDSSHWSDSVPVLLLAGRRGLLSDALAQMVRELGIEEHVRLLGHRDDVPSLLEAADLFVLPSLHEGMPGALLEAMGLGKACIASNIGPVLEVITDGIDGVIVPARDPRALADAIARLAFDVSCRATLGAAAQRRIVSAFSARAAAGALEELYQEMAREG